MLFMIETTQQMDHSYTASVLINHISQISDIPREEITFETPLLEYNILDSVSIFSLLTFISVELEVEIPLDKVKAESFATVASICKLIDECKQLIEETV